MHRGTTLLVGHATLDEWHAFVQSEDAAMSARFLAWFGSETATTDGRTTMGEIRIVEFPVGTTHESFAIMLAYSILSDPAVKRCLTCHAGSSNTLGPQSRPDMSFGPKQSVIQPLGVMLPHGVLAWDELVTIKIEVGVCQDWGETIGGLDWKASQWGPVPVVAYVLCIRVDNDMRNAAYKLYEVLPTGRRSQYQPNAAMIVAPETIVQFDAWRVLGLGPGDPVPAGFPDPFDVDLYGVLQEVRGQR